jgi:uncharacterized protein YdaU (DUF1376 family)
MKNPAVLLYISDWLTSTAEMDADCRGWYLNLLLHHYDKGSLPFEVENLALLAGVKHSEYNRFEHVFEHMLKHKFELNNEGRLINARAIAILQKRETYEAIRSDSGKISWIIRYFKKHYKDYCTKDFVDFVKTKLKSFKIDDIDTKSEHMLKHMFEHMFKLYGTGNNSYKNNDISSFSKEESYSEITEQGGEISPLPIVPAPSEVILVNPHAWQPDKTLTECKAELLKSQSWLEQVTMNKRLVSIRDTEVWLIQFFSTLAADGITHKGVADAKKHFNRWLGLQIQNKTTTNANNKSTTSRQDEAIAGFSSRLEERNNAFLARQQQESD